MNFKRIVLCLLTVTILGVFCITPVTFAAAQKYGIDNLNNEAGELKIAYLGGSITEGSGASPQSNRWSTLVTKEFFQKRFPNKTVIEVNAGVGGTCSDLGMYRMRKDFIAEEPDVVFVEFAVNDAGRSDPTASKPYMEGIVRQLAKLPKQPVIIFVLTTKAGGRDKLAVSIAAHKEVAAYYGIGVIDLDAYIWDLVDKGEAVWEKGVPGTLTADGTHPNNDGYRAYADYMIGQFKKSYNTYFKKLNWQEMPMTNHEYGEPKTISHADNKATYSGNWKLVTDNWPIESGRIANMKRAFPEGTKVSTQAGDTVTFEFTGTMIGLYGGKGDIGGSADYVITDESGREEARGTINAYQKLKQSGDARLMPMNILLREGLPYGKHTIKLTTKEGIKNDFGYVQNYFSFGYFFVDDVLPSLPPLAKNVSLSGQNAVGSVLTGSYTYQNLNDYVKDEQGTVIRWLRSDRSNGGFTEIPGANQNTYTTTFEDAGKYIKFEVTPVNSRGIKGAAVSSAPIQVEYKNAASILSVVEPFAYSRGGAAVTELTEGEITAGIKLKNTYSLPVAVTMVTVVYDTSGAARRMIDMDRMSLSIGAGKTEELTATVNVDTVTNREVKTVLLLNSSLEPIVPVEDTLLQ